MYRADDSEQDYTFIILIPFTKILSNGRKKYSSHARHFVNSSLTHARDWVSQASGLFLNSSFPFFV